MAFLELSNIFKSYFLGKQEFPVLKGINLSFDKGEFVSILGESGGGKTTLMNIIGGLDRNFEGTVTVDGQVIDHRNARQLDIYRRKTVGYIFQSFNLINYQTNLENVETSLNMTTLNRAQRKKRAKELLDKVGLGEHVNKYPSQLSGGQKQRVAIARALAGNPDIMIADEPTGALDSGNTKEVLELLDQIAQEGKLVIVVTHSQEVANFGTRIVHMEDGKIGKQEVLKDKYPVPRFSTRDRFKSKPLSAGTIWSMAYDHMKFKKLQSFLVILGSAIGLGAVILFLGLGNGIKGYITEQTTSLVNPNYPTVTKNVDKDSSASDDDKQDAYSQALMSNYASVTIDDKGLDKLAKIKHVDKVYPGYQFSGASFTIGDQTKSGAYLTWTPQFTNKTLSAGSAPTQAGEIVVSKDFAQKINKNNWKSVIGQTVTVTFTTFDAENNQVQVTATPKVSGISGSGSTAIFAGSYAGMKAALTKAGAVTNANTVQVGVDKTANVKQVANDIKALKDSDGKQSYNVQTVGDTLSTINTITTLASRVVAAIAGISLVVSAIMIIVTTYMSVSERTQEIGVLRALGARAKDIGSLFTYEALLVGLISAGLAIVAAFALQLLMNGALHSLIKYNIVQISFGDVIFAVVISVFIAWVASFVPSRRAAHLNTIDALAAS
ncbi:ATP-binding cassette domain-containing protein [Lactobacillaceae bacterium L1_55_11]|nr:ATP-binding cassette domain-containing protein [Lactobacillaceae bacterium L1_55_11]